MKPYKVLSGLFAIVAASPSYGEAMDYRVTASMHEELVHVGSNINITLNFENLGHTQILLSHVIGDGAASDYNVSFTRENGNTPERTPFFKYLNNEIDPRILSDGTAMPPSTVSYGFSGIAPGKSFSQTLRLNSLFQITRPGTYTFSASRKGPDGRNVTSNSIIITVYR